MILSVIEQERKDRALLEGMDSRYFGASPCRTIYAAGVSFAPERDLNPAMKMAVPTPEKARVNGSWGGAARVRLTATRRKASPETIAACKHEYRNNGHKNGKQRLCCKYCFDYRS